MKKGNWVSCVVACIGLGFASTAPGAAYVLSGERFVDYLDVTLKVGQLTDLKELAETVGADPSAADTSPLESVGLTFGYSGWTVSPLLLGSITLTDGLTGLTEIPDHANMSFGLIFGLANPRLMTDSFELATFSLRLPTGPQGGTLTLLSANLAPLATFDQGSFVGPSLAVAAVPEPEVYAMMLVGLGLIGLRFDRRRAKLLRKRAAADPDIKGVAT